MFGGSFEAADAALTMARALRAAYRRDGSPPSTNMVNAMVFAAHHELALARRSDDPTVLPRLIEELTDLYATLPPEQENRFAIAVILAEVHRNRPPALRIWPSSAPRPGTCGTWWRPTSGRSPDCSHRTSRPYGPTR
ncbi:hypothetical protein SAZ11_60765 [Streptomyces sp. FXJ1.4098]|nr:hypothetical protein [Streptomyces sp. FXJ1.4098]